MESGDQEHQAHGEAFEDSPPRAEYSVVEATEDQLQVWIPPPRPNTVCLRLSGACKQVFMDSHDAALSAADENDRVREAGSALTGAFAHNPSRCRPLCCFIPMLFHPSISLVASPNPPRVMCGSKAARGVAPPVRTGSGCQGKSRTGVQRLPVHRFFRDFRY